MSATSSPTIVQLIGALRAPEPISITLLFFSAREARQPFYTAIGDVAARTRHITEPLANLAPWR
jgi:hypothetical protein